jgi:hypothetical protein
MRLGLEARFTRPCSSGLGVTIAGAELHAESARIAGSRSVGPGSGTIAP